MGAIGYRVRTQLRSGWMAITALALLVGLAGGAVLTTVAAARRTDSAFDRMVRADRVSPALVNPDQGDGSKLTMSELRKLPAVARATRINFASTLPAQKMTSISDFASTPAIVILEDGYGTTNNRFVIDSGRMPNPARADEVFVERWFADANHLHVGSSIPIRAMSGDEMSQFQQSDGPPDVSALNAIGTPYRLNVVGIGGTPESVAYDQGFEPDPLIGTEAYWRKFHEPSASYWGASIDLKPGATVEQLRRQVDALHPDEAFAIQSLASTRTQVDRAVSPQVVALWVFAAVAVFVALLVVGQAVSRRLAADGVDNLTLDAMGMSHRDRFAAAMTRIAIVGVVGAGISILVAYLLSPIAPIGPARLAEVSPGFAADWWVLLIGGVAVALVTCAIGAWPAWRTSRVFVSTEEPRPSRVSARLAAAGASIAATTGVRFALEPGTRARPIPARSTILTAATAVVVVVAVITFASSIDHLVETPRLFGFPASFVIVNQGDNGDQAAAQLATVLKRDPQVKSWSTVQVSELDLNGRTTPTVAFQDGARPLHPVLRAGRTPKDDHEVALGSSTMHSLGVGLGDSVRLGTKGDTARVVGTVVMPAVGTYEGADKAGLGEGMLVTPHALHRFGPSFDTSSGKVAVQANPGVTLRSFEQTAARLGVAPDAGLDISTVPAPSDITALRRLRSTPVVLGALLALLITSTVVHSLLLAIRRRRHDVAVLQCMGIRPGQVIRSALWQATTISAFALVVGVPLGIVAGRWTWVVLAGALGAVAEPTIPAAAIAVVACAVLLVALVAGLVPGWRSSRRHPALVLRSE
jgi:ABC-type lipoprotein release transport system permease subunit